MSSQHPNAHLIGAECMLTLAKIHVIRSLKLIALLTVVLWIKMNARIRVKLSRHLNVPMNGAWFMTTNAKTNAMILQRLIARPAMTNV